MCAVLVAVVSQVVVMNTILSLCVSVYNRYHLLYVDLYAVYIGYSVPCVRNRINYINGI